MEDNLQAALTTTRFLVNKDSPLYGYAFVPVCCAEISMSIFGMNEREELDLAILCKGMAQKVHINSTDKTVFIGVDPEDEETGLVVYKEKLDTKYIRDFFTLWDNIHTVLFEFRVFNYKNEDIFVLKGYWEKGHWAFLDINPSRSTHIISKVEKE